MKFKVVEEDPTDGSVGGYAPATTTVDVTDVARPDYFSHADEVLADRFREDGYVITEINHSPSGGTIHVREKPYSPESEYSEPEYSEPEYSELDF